MLPILLTLIVAAEPATKDPLADQLDRAEALLGALTKGEFEKAARDFDAGMRKALPGDKLKQTWERIIKQVGKLEKQTARRVEKGTKTDVVYLTCKFEKATLDLKVVFNADKKITGFFLVPATGAITFKPPPYAKANNYHERKVTIGSAWKLPGTLTLPRGDGPFPAVVLIHGSGPNDRDETIGANKPLRDLGWGLATQGVAVLRYEKRTREHGARYVAIKDATYKDEVLDDALAAIALLRKQKEIDGKRIFVLGHSLGGYLAPRMAELDAKVAGIIILAGNARPLEDLILEQFTYLYSLDDPLLEKHKKALTELKEKVARVKSDTLKHAKAKDLPLGIPASYWLWMRAYQPATTASKLKRPILLLQGERDYQVTMADFKVWKKSLDGKKNAKLVSYPKLNHLFMEGGGKSQPGEYLKTGHVAKEVIDQISGWVKEQKESGN